ncbi:hypothetical protein Dacsa_2350 [Dactylococcopsis salina PCC 8305]|uniref:Uncharacterized protein n=1 Tax=Dactylococcopsis salina (strain PCC 8305) TaxID=13035 RepID=K9YXA0_DACS8|nr:hypothetical protein Dacsa_2350 [Dactylococcopsis salina PCC 8305]
MYTVFGNATMSIWTLGLNLNQITGDIFSLDRDIISRMINYHQTSLLQRELPSNFPLTKGITIKLPSYKGNYHQTSLLQRELPSNFPLTKGITIKLPPFQRGARGDKSKP